MQVLRSGGAASPVKAQLGGGGGAQSLSAADLCHVSVLSFNTNSIHISGSTVSL